MKLARHADDRLAERTNLPLNTVNALEIELRKQWAKTPDALPNKFHVPLYQHGNVKGYAAVSRFGSKPTITTVLSPHMQPSGKRMFAFDADEGQMMSSKTAWYLGIGR
jgi:hypothetical protein